MKTTTTYAEINVHDVVFYEGLVTSVLAASNVFETEEGAKVRELYIITALDDEPRTVLVDPETKVKMLDYKNYTNRSFN